MKYFESIDDADVYCPLVVCVTCKLYLAKASKGSSPTPPSRFPWPIIRCTRLNACRFLLKTGDENNACVMCAEATRFGSRRNTPKSILHRNAARPMEKSPQKSIMVCNKCATRISRGNEHSCTTTSLISNTRLSLQYRNCVGHFIADGIVPKLGRAINFYSTLARPGGGHPIHINASASKSLDRPIAKNTLHLDMKDISGFKRAGVGTTNNMLKQFTHIIRKA